ncbi:LPS assembly lipoprotein LptE [Desulfatitalea alkaliphila]|uniref:LPS assembly lipoprotein LptE n=1 Tax=Desulfatitalea alkaliphila TaxID=2929485 RepID=A0AA41R7A9_9BACT|nr:LptE family protein [Desulfatitalea alkaliphila]MCJ8502550.1 LPS assembly lipoprotein LptE [Desulfatitalea alkaliphila]
MLNSTSCPGKGTGGRRRWLLRSAFLGLLTLLTACGYQLAGEGPLPGGVNTIAVTMLANRTGESGVEAVMTNALIDELTRRRQGVLVDAQRADAVLSGTITGLSADTLSRSATLTARERRLVVTASLTLKDRNGNVLWQEGQLRAETSYPVAGTKAGTETNRRLAIGKVAQRLAEYVYERLTDTF